MHKILVKINIFNPFLCVQRLYLQGMSSNVKAMEARMIFLRFLMDLSLSAVVP